LNRDESFKKIGSGTEGDKMENTKGMNCTNNGSGKKLVEINRKEESGGLCQNTKLQK
jgi:hypothetical protein